MAGKHKDRKDEPHPDVEPARTDTVRMPESEDTKKLPASTPQSGFGADLSGVIMVDQLSDSHVIPEVQEFRQNYDQSASDSRHSRVVSEEPVTQARSAVSAESSAVAATPVAPEKKPPAGSGGLVLNKTIVWAVITGAIGLTASVIGIYEFTRPAAKPPTVLVVGKSPDYQSLMSRHAGSEADVNNFETPLDSQKWTELLTNGDLEKRDPGKTVYAGLRMARDFAAKRTNPNKTGQETQFRFLPIKGRDWNALAQKIHNENADLVILDANSTNSRTIIEEMRRIGCETKVLLAGQTSVVAQENFSRSEANPLRNVIQLLPHDRKQGEIIGTEIVGKYDAEDDPGNISIYCDCRNSMYSNMLCGSFLKTLTGQVERSVVIHAGIGELPITDDSSIRQSTVVGDDLIDYDIGTVVYLGNDEKSAARLIRQWHLKLREKHPEDSTDVREYWFVVPEGMHGNKYFVQTVRDLADTDANRNRSLIRVWATSPFPNLQWQREHLNEAGGNDVLKLVNEQLGPNAKIGFAAMMLADELVQSDSADDRFSGIMDGTDMSLIRNIWKQDPDFASEEISYERVDLDVDPVSQSAETASDPAGP